MSSYKLVWNEDAWVDSIYWQRVDKKALKKINQLIKEILRTPFEGMGKPEPLRHGLAGSWSRRITGEHRLVYEVLDEVIVIQQCRFHY